MRISVTQQYIKQGKRMGDCHYAVTQAIKRATKGTRTVAVGYNACWIDGKPYDLPETARGFIVGCATGQNVEPFEFDLPVAA